MSLHQQALELDAQDPLARMREAFLIPTDKDGNSLIYLCGNSLGLQPKSVRAHLETELDDWAKFGVEGHFHGTNPWYDYHEFVSPLMADVVGAKPGEVVVMNALTVNLHLMMVSFYRPTATRYKILIEGGAFPSDHYAVASQVAFHGHDPKDAIIELNPREGEYTLRAEDIEQVIAQHGQDIALVMLGGVNYYTGQVLPMRQIVKWGHQQGCMVGFDLAHAVGNVHLKLHDDGADFAVWCSYKYLNSGPGGVAGCFVHERHKEDHTLPRFAGWWGNDPSTRFEMDKTFTAQPGAAGWQLSNAPVLPMASLKASLALFEQATMAKLRQKSVQLTALMLAGIDAIPNERFEIITPRDVESRGCQLSIRTKFDGERLFNALTQAGIVCDFRRPDVIRVAPTPMYNTFGEVAQFCDILADVAGQ